MKEFTVSTHPDGTDTGNAKLGRSKALAKSRLNVSAALRLDEEGRIDFARIAPGCIFSTPDRVETAENILIGRKPSEELWREAGKAVSEEMIRRTGIRWSTEYKQPAVEAIVEDALTECCGSQFA